MDIHYKKRTIIFMGLAYACILCGLLLLHFSLKSDSVGFLSILGGSLNFTGFIFLIIGSVFWSLGKNYGVARGIFIGFFLNLLSPIILALHKYKSYPVSVNFCANCGKRVFPFSIPGGMRSGSLGDLINEEKKEVKKIEANNAYICDECKAIICPVCLGKKGSEMGIRMFVCTECGHKPVETIFR